MPLSSIRKIWKYVYGLFVASLLMLLVGASNADPQWMLEPHQSDKYSFNRFIESIDKFPYTANESKLSRVKEGFKRLSLGMKKDDVKKIMGEPDAELLTTSS
ncbi:MAG: hypothetical protein ACYC9J_13100 [Sulfuricaulis sp.]